MDDAQARELVGRVEELLEQLEALPDPAVREPALEVIGALLDLYGEGITRLVAAVPEPVRLAEDELVSHLMLLHEIHPVPVEDRVRAALEEVRPYLESHGGDVELLGVSGGKARLRMSGSCDGCPSSAMTLKLAIESSIHKLAPEVEVVDDSAPPPVPAGPALIQLEPLGAPAAPAPEAEWASAGALRQLSNGMMLAQEVSGEPVLFMRVDGSFYAYRPACAGCGEPLAGGELSGTEVRCTTCGNRFDVTRAGRCPDTPELHLEPVPLLEDDGGIVRVALAATAA